MESVTQMSGLRESLNFFVFALFELTLLFIGISFIVGCINEVLPKEKVKALLAGRQGRGYFIGAALGGLTPFCSCSTIPMMVGLLKAGAGFGPTMSFLFASPLVNPILVGLFFGLLGGKITLVYSILALSFAILSGFVLEKMGFQKYIKETVAAEGCGCIPQNEPGSLSAVQPAANIMSFESIQPVQVQTELQGVACCAEPRTGATQVIGSKWKNILRESVKQFTTFFPYIIVGVGIGSIIHGFMPASLVTDLAGSNNPAAIPVSAVIGIPLYIRAAAMVPMAASLVGKGMSMGAVIALIIGGAGASLPEVAMLKGLFKIQLLLAFLATVFFTAVSSGFIINMIM